MQEYSLTKEASLEYDHRRDVVAEAIMEEENLEEMDRVRNPIAKARGLSQS